MVLVAREVLVEDPADPALVALVLEAQADSEAPVEVLAVLRKKKIERPNR